MNATLSGIRAETLSLHHSQKTHRSKASTAAANSEARRGIRRRTTDVISQFQSKTRKQLTKNKKTIIKQSSENTHKMDDTQRIVKCGNLLLHSNGGFFKKRWHNKYLVLYDGSKSGIKRLELFDSEIKFKKQNPAKIIPLVDCVRVVTCQRHKSTYTFEVRTNDQFYLLAAQSFQDMNDWVNCLRLVAFGQTATQQQQQQQQQQQLQSTATNNLISSKQSQRSTGVQQQTVDVLLERRLLQNNSSSSSAVPTTTTGNNQQVATIMSRGGIATTTIVATSQATQSSSAVDQQRRRQHQQMATTPSSDNQTGASSAGATSAVLTASQAAAAAASALAKTRQRQPSLLGSCKPQPPNDSPFIKQQQQQLVEAQQPLLLVDNSSSTQAAAGTKLLNSMGQIDTLTPTVRGQLIQATRLASGKPAINGAPAKQQQQSASAAVAIPATLDEEEENMLYCSIEDNPSEHNYRVKVIETELALRCQLKCYQLTAPTTISQQYEELSQFRQKLNSTTASAAANNNLTVQLNNTTNSKSCDPPSQHNQAPAVEIITFYQLIIGPQELTLLNDYNVAPRSAATMTKQKQGLWSWPYQCIRRYGFDKDNCFMFEAGRKCSSGPGQFVVQTPKAYNIYQDVVKFVNELRTVNPPSLNSGSSTHHSMDNINVALQQLATARQQQPQLVSITQIPVVWAPSDHRVNIAQQQQQGDQTDGRGTTTTTRQFFDALRQLDTSSSSAAASMTNNQIPTAANFHPKQQQETTKLENLINNNNNIADETKQLQQSQKSSISSSSTTTITSHESIDSRASPTSSSSSSSSSSSCRLTAASAGGANQIQSLISNNQSKTMPTNGKTTTTSSTSEHETDESGYEQGDESVDSCSSAKTRFKGLSVSSVDSSCSLSSAAGGGNARKRQQLAATVGATTTTDSMSSSSSTTSSSSAANSPTSQTAASRLQQQQQQQLEVPAKPARQSTGNDGLAVQQPPTNNQQQSRQTKSIRHELNSLIADGVTSLDGRRPADFEANLIREVYSEITKLHAKFAVTTNGSSADDSMSSHSSSFSGGSKEEEEEDADADDERGAANLMTGMNEPMYSNVLMDEDNRVESRKARQDISKSRRARLDDDEDHFDGGQLYTADHQFRFNNNHRRTNSTKPQQPLQQQQHQQPINYRPQNKSYLEQQQQMSPARSMYGIPSMLNPIPECAEMAQQQNGNKLTAQLAPPPPLAPKPNNNNNNNRYNLKHSSSLSSINAPRSLDQCLNAALDDHQGGGGLPRARLTNSRDDIKKKSTTSNQKFNKLTDVKLKPTNHYVINDVQYAKISRNFN